MALTKDLYKQWFLNRGSVNKFPGGREPWSTVQHWKIDQ